MFCATVYGADEKNIFSRWDIKKVIYKDGGKSFVPKTYGGITFVKGDPITVRWHDGVNWVGATAEIDGDKIRIKGMGSTMIGSTMKIEDVHYGKVTSYKIDGDKLELYTPTQTYLMERYPYSKMSEYGWSLASITENKTKKSLNVDRFRGSYRSLYFRADKDKTFTFYDLDREEFSGTMKVEGDKILGMELDENSRKRAKDKPVTHSRLSDRSKGYKKTTNEYPTAYVKEMDFGSINRYEIVNNQLVLYTPDKTYRFNQR